MRLRPWMRRLLMLARMHSPAPDDLRSYFLTNRNRPTRKLLHYLDVYELHFARLRNAAPVLVEIGIWDGGGLEMWRHYFGPDATIIGVDIKPARVAAMREQGFVVEVGDQADPEFWSGFKQRHPRVDILIDDGGHEMHQQRIAFECMFPHIAEGGLYVCEDLHTSYYRKNGGGWRNPESFVEYTKGLIDELNAWWVEAASPLRPTQFTDLCTGMHFYDSLLVLERGAHRRPQHAKSGGGVVKYGELGRPVIDMDGVARQPIGSSCNSGADR